MGQQCSQQRCCAEDRAMVGANSPLADHSFDTSESTQEQAEPEQQGEQEAGVPDTPASGAGLVGGSAPASDGAGHKPELDPESHIRGAGSLHSYFNREAKQTQAMSSGATSSSYLERRGPVTFTTGAVYDGQWRGQSRHGFGRQTWLDGTSYVGEWIENQAEGKGCFEHSNGDKYIGCWRANFAHGLGAYYNKDGLTYHGEWFHDLQEGSGLEERKGEGDQVSIYEGDFRGGLKEGRGVYKWGDGSEYRGSWNGNSIDGLGVYIGNDGCWFKGRWSDSVMHGLGAYVWKDGREYYGQYKFDKKDGFGVFTWLDGKKYEGFWKRGKQHGHGLYTTAEGLAKSAQWVEGRRKDPALTSSITEISVSFLCSEDTQSHFGERQVSTGNSGLSPLCCASPIKGIIKKGISSGSSKTSSSFAQVEGGGVRHRVEDFLRRTSSYVPSPSSCQR